jgi:hypothetical protein
MYRLSDRSPRRGVVPKKRVPPKSRPAASFRDCSPADTARKDSAVHVSLSSDSLVKQPGDRGDPLSLVSPESRRNSKPPTETGVLSHQW